MGVVPPLGETRPAWKVLRVLGNVLQLPGFDYDSSDAVRAEVLGDGVEHGVAERLNNRLSGSPKINLARNSQVTLQRVADVPIYHADALVRRAQSLQQTKDARQPVACMHPDTFASLGLTTGVKVRVKQNGGEAILDASIDDRLPINCVRVAAAHPATSDLGGMFEEITVEQAH